MARASQGDVNRNSFAKTICSICFEDLKPVVEDLQAISVCGHVFHELCLQQWFEYCPNLKKRCCPICKQACTNTNVGRLYFQSIGDSNDCISQKPRDCNESPEELQKEVNRLEGKVAGLSSSLEQQKKDFKEVKDELLVCREQLKTEVALKAEAQIQLAISEKSLAMKTQSLVQSNLECVRFKEKNMALAKELAAYRLAHDMDLKEDDAMKLASLGNDGSSNDGNYLLIKSLDSHKRSYKELLAKCNDLRRRETRNCEELENANKKIKKLKLRVRELETAVEVKENDALRVLKDQNTKLKRNSHENQMKRPANLAGLDDIPDMSFGMEREELPNPTMNVKECSHKTSIPCAKENVIVEERHDPRQVSCFDGINVDSEEKDRAFCSLSMRKGLKRHRASDIPSKVEDDVICLGDTSPVQTSVHNVKDTSASTPVYQPDSHCFTGGLRGPDGTNWHLGKWCKKAQNQESGDLIAVGADGRGGKIKVMRSSLHQSSLGINDNSMKICKQSSKPNKVQAQGVLQIDHFFRRAGQ